MDYQTVGCANRATTPAEDKARTWGEARYALDVARNRAKEAQDALEVATNAESQAWNELECEAGRAIPKPCAPPVSPLRVR